MYFLVVGLGLAVLIACFLYISKEADYREKMYKKKFKFARLNLIVQTETKNTIGHSYPLVSAEFVVGRKSLLPTVDLKIKTTDKTLSRSAARFFFTGKEFCIQRLNQEKIWIKSKGGKVYLIAANDETPIKNVGFGAESYETVTEKSVLLFPGDMILMGKTMLEYDEGDVGIYG